MKRGLFNLKQSKSLCALCNTINLIISAGAKVDYVQLRMESMDAHHSNAHPLCVLVLPRFIHHLGKEQLWHHYSHLLITILI